MVHVSEQSYCSATQNSCTYGITAKNETGEKEKKKTMKKSFVLSRQAHLFVSFLHFTTVTQYKPAKSLTHPIR